jgi:hypothetical protein
MLTDQVKTLVTLSFFRGIVWIGFIYVGVVLLRLVPSNGKGPAAVPRGKVIQLGWILFAFCIATLLAQIWPGLGPFALDAGEVVGIGLLAYVGWWGVLRVSRLDDVPRWVRITLFVVWIGFLFVLKDL